MKASKIEAAAKALLAVYRLNFTDWDDCTEEGKERWRIEAASILKAAEEAE